MDAQLKIYEGTSDSLGQGRVLNNRYELLLPIARGGMGQVWIARLKGTRGFRKLVAVKTLIRSDYIASDNVELLMEVEASVSSLIHHPNVVETLELGESEGTVYIAMELVNGESIQHVSMKAAQAGGLPLRFAVNILGQISRGLHAAHELRDHKGDFAGLVHRDLSPQNILITYDGHVKIIDFGVAKVGFADTMTQAGTVKGKLSFMAPEQMFNDEIDRRADLFSLGVIAYILTTGTHPFKASSERDTLANVINNPPKPPTSFVEGYPKALEDVILKALAKKKTERWNSAAEFLHALEQVMPEAFASGADRELAGYLSTLLADRAAERRRVIQQAEAMSDNTSVTSSGIVNKQPKASGHPTAVTEVIVPPKSETAAGTSIPAAPAVPTIERSSGKALLYIMALTSLAAVGGSLLYSATKPVHVTSSAPVPAQTAAPKPKAAVGEFAPMVVIEGAPKPAQEEEEALPLPPASSAPRAVPARGQAPQKKKEQTDNPYDDRIDIAKAIATAQETQEAAPEPVPVEPPPAPVVVKEAPRPAPVPPTTPRNVAARVGHGLLSINPNSDPYRATVPRSLASIGEFSTTVRLCVAPSGDVQSVSVLKPLGEAVDARIVSALRRWKYRSLMENGQAVAFCYSFSYSF